MKLPAEIVELLDKIVVVQEGRRIDDLSEKFISVSFEVLGDEYMVEGHAIVWKRSQVTFEEAERVLEALDQELATALWDAATLGTLTRD